MADKTVTLTITDPEGKDQSITVPEDEADRYTHGGWSVVDDKKSTTTK
jgi:hypothetical protein